MEDYAKPLNFGMKQQTARQSQWESVKHDLRSLFPQDVFHTWFEPMRCVSDSDETITLSVPNEFAAYWIQDNYGELLSTRLEQAYGRPTGFRLQVTEQVPAVEKNGGGMNRLNGSQPYGTEDRMSEREDQGDDRGSRQGSSLGKDMYLINPKNTFENFVVGSGNQMAHACAIAVANAPARTYNPLFLYGDTGLGKTHLMHAVALHIRNNNPDASVAYVTTEKFTNKFIRALQDNSLTKFRRRYRRVDVLLIDDIHFLSGKERIQEEMFHTFNELYESQKQIIIASDRPANEIAKLENRLVSRFGWGMVADIQPPDLETRQAILAKKAKAMNIRIDEEIIHFLAKRIPRNIRRMEGALTRVGAFSSLTKNRIDIDSIEHLLKDMLLEEAQQQVTVEKIQKRVSDQYQLRMADMTSKRRPANIAFPRQIAMYLSRMLTNNSLQEIGDAFGGRDHGTVIHAIKTVENMMEQDESVRRSVEYLKKNLADNC